MSRLDELIKELCPDGVEYHLLGELGSFYGGITGKKKDDFVDGNAKFITYKNVYANPALDLNTNDKVKILAGEKQRILEYGDVIFTGSSETPNECGISSVVTQQPKEELYLNSFCFFFRFYDSAIMNPDFAKHLFRSDGLRYQIGKTASGVTRFNVSKKMMGKVKIPVPPLEVQNEIARILDNFTELTDELTAKLTAELTARQKQYEFYRDKLLDFGVLGGGASECVWKTLAELGKWSGGKTPSMAEKAYWTDGTIPWISSKDMKASTLSDTQDHITEKAVNGASMTVYPANSIAIVTRSGILKHTFPAAYVPFETTVNQDIKMLVVNDEVLPRYAFHVIQGKGKDILVKTKKQGGTVDSLDFQKVLAYKVPVPSKDVQSRLVKVLDNFDAICSDLNIGLPAEIEVRQKQYEYYRDMLLTFAESGNTISRAEQSRAERSN